MPLTGRFGFRKSLMGKIVLQLEEEALVSAVFSRRQKYRSRWRDARFMDLVHPEIRGLISFKDYVQDCPHANFATPSLSQLGGRRADRFSTPEPVLNSEPAPDKRTNGSGERQVRSNGSGEHAGQSAL